RSAGASPTARSTARPEASPAAPTRGPAPPRPGAPPERARRPSPTRNPRQAHARTKSRASELWLAFVDQLGQLLRLEHHLELARTVGGEMLLPACQPRPVCGGVRVVAGESLDVQRQP